jgi:hypothetical protein
MRNGFALAAFLLFAAGTPAFAQFAGVGTPGNLGNVWQTGTVPVPNIYTARQTPNLQPTAQLQPVSNQSAAWPAWYSQTLGMPLAGGRIFAGGTAGMFYDDNVFATNTHRLADWAFFQRPEFAWVRQGQNYTVTTDGFIEGREYTTYTSENQVNGSFGSNFTVMPDNNTQVVGGVRYIHEHLDRGSSETVISIPGMPSVLLSTLFSHPVAYDEGLESVALNKRYGNWWSSFGAAGLEINYQNATIGGPNPFGPSPFPASPFSGDSVNFSYADGGIGAVNARVGYVVMPLTSVFAEAAGNTRDWGVGYFDSNGYRVVVGMLFEQGPGARVKGEFWGGYMNQLYSGVTMQNISTWTYGLGLTGLIADNLTGVIEGRREAKEAALGLALLTPTELGASGATCAADIAVCVSTIETEAGARLDYRILPQVVIGGGVTYLEDDYQGPLAFGRVDRTLGPLASIKYFATPNMTFGFDYRDIVFNSSGGTAPAPFTSVAALPFYRNIYMFWVNGKF